MIIAEVPEFFRDEGLTTRGMRGIPRDSLLSLCGETASSGLSFSLMEGTNQIEVCVMVSEFVAGMARTFPQASLSVPISRQQTRELKRKTLNLVMHEACLLLFLHRYNLDRAILLK
jgi:hypothetical protein